MGLMTSLKSLFSKKTDLPNTWEMTEEAYAMFPLHLLTNNEPPFDQWQKPGSHVSENLVQFWKGAIAQYQLFSFHAVNISTWGNEFGEKVLNIQVRLMNQTEPGWGDNHETGIRTIYDVVLRAMNNPMHVIGKSGEQLEVPIENRLAMELLVTSPDSPFITNREAMDKAGPPVFPNEEDWKLAIDLENAKDKAMDYFQRAAKVVRFVNNE